MKGIRKLICLIIIIVASGCSTSESSHSLSTQQATSVDEKSEILNQLERALTLAEGDEEDEAYKIYSEILEQEENPAAYVGIAYLYAKKKNYQKAIEYIDYTYKTLPATLNPDQQASIYYTIANIYQGSWIYEGDEWEQAAIEAYNKAAELPGISEKNTHYYTYQAYVHIVNILQGHSDRESIEACIQGTQALLESDEANAAHYAYRLADFYGQLGEFEKARKYMDSLQVEDEEGKIDLIFTNAKYYCYKGDYEKAKEYMDQLNEQNCKNQKEKYLLLKAFYGNKVGDDQAVKENIEALLDLSMTNLNLGIVQTILEESGVIIDPRYEAALEEEKQEKYAIVLGQ